MRQVLVPYKLTLLSNLLTLTAGNIYVLVPYKLTLLSNEKVPVSTVAPVLVPYKLTLLSNNVTRTIMYASVLVPYKLTLLSNLKFASKCENGTTTARFDRHGDCTVTCVKSEFTQIRIYCYSFFKLQTLILRIFNHEQAVFVINAGFHE